VTKKQFVVEHFCFLVHIFC